MTKQQEAKKELKQEAKQGVKQGVMTFTFGELSENSVGMEQIGNGLGKVGSGFTEDDLLEIKKKFEDMGGECEMHNLNDLIDGKGDVARFLVLRKGLNVMMKDKEYDKKMYEEYLKLDWDKKMWMRGRVVNKLARWNLCFSNFEQAPDYENGKGKIYDINTLKHGNFRGDKFVEFFGEKSKNLEMEGNYYFDKKKCGIGWHGDTERRKVIALRLGESMNLKYKWWSRFQDFGKEFEVMLNSGDMYVMSEKSVGNDWKKSSIYSLRHCVGEGRFSKFKPKKEKESKDKSKDKSKVKKKIKLHPKINKKN